MSKYDPRPDLGDLLHAALWGQRDVTAIADRIAEQIGLGEDDSREAVTEELGKALGIPAPAMRRGRQDASAS